MAHSRKCRKKTHNCFNYWMSSYGGVSLKKSNTEILGTFSEWWMECDDQEQKHNLLFLFHHLFERQWWHAHIWSSKLDICRYKSNVNAHTTLSNLTTTTKKTETKKINLFWHVKIQQVIKYATNACHSVKSNVCFDSFRFVPYFNNV